MKRTIKIRLYPNKQQKDVLNKHFGCCRFIYNAALNYKMTMYRDYHVKVSKYDIVNQLVDVKKEYDWLNETKAECLQNVIDHLDFAYRQFFKGGGYPKFKSKRNKQSFLQKQNFKILKEIDKIVFLKHKIKFKCSERDKDLIRNNKINRITYSKDKIGNYYASVLIECEIEKLPKTNSEIGIDLGIKSFLVTSNQEFVENPKFFNKTLKQIKRLNKQLSKKQKGSKNKEKTRIKLAKKHLKITNQRDYFLHNLSSKLINENQIICLESLNIKGLLEEKKLARHIQDASWGKFISMLTYKAEWRGREIKRIDRFYPSSKTCSNCGSIRKDLTLRDRTFKCNNCGLEIDRDYNASLNILKIGINHPELKLVENLSLDKSMKQEIKT